MKNYPKVSFFDRILCIQIWEIIMERNIIGDLLILKQMNIKLNFSELAGIYDMDSHTVAKYWREGGKKMERKPKKVFWINLAMKSLGCLKSQVSISVLHMSIF